MLWHSHICFNVIFHVVEWATVYWVVVFIYGSEYKQRNLFLHLLSSICAMFWLKIFLAMCVMLKLLNVFGDMAQKIFLYKTVLAVGKVDTRSKYMFTPRVCVFVCVCVCVCVCAFGVFFSLLRRERERWI